MKNAIKNCQVNTTATPVYQAVMMDKDSKTDWSELAVISRSEKPVEKKESQWFGFHILNLQLGADVFVFTENHLNGCLDKFAKKAKEEEKQIPAFTVEMEEKNGEFIAGEETENGIGYINPAYQFRVNAGILEMRLKA